MRVFWHLNWDITSQFFNSTKKLITSGTFILTLKHMSVHFWHRAFEVNTFALGFTVFTVSSVSLLSSVFVASVLGWFIGRCLLSSTLVWLLGSWLLIFTYWATVLWWWWTCTSGIRSHDEVTCYSINCKFLKLQE